MSNRLYHAAQPVLPLILFTFVLSPEECLGMIHCHLMGQAVIYYLTLLAASGR